MLKRTEHFIDLLWDLRDVYDHGPEGRDAVDQYTHCVQMATRAHRRGLPDRLVALAALHDAFRVVAPLTHGESLALALSDRLTDDEQAILKHHSLWQHDVIHGTSHTVVFFEEPWYESACIFGHLDAASFDPHYSHLPIQFFIPKIRSLLDD